MQAVLRSRMRGAAYVSRAAVASLSINILSLSLPIFIRKVYDRIIPNQAETTALLLASGVGTALALETLLKVGRAQILGPVASRYEAVTTVAAARHLLAANLAAFERVSPGRHLERLSAIPRLRDHGSGQALLPVYDIPFLFAFLALIWVLGGVLVVVPMVGFLVLAVAALPAGVQSRRALQAAADTDDVRYDFLIATLTGLQALKIMAAERLLLRRYEALQRRRLAAQGTAYMAG
ncbi:hypothetical protein F1188_06120 [Roseospira marina]|uniref:ABC transmembrane type-1 domain-containing protein n=1 Tax=Roseospira marina TaxID=140057 RepID=A0A5M6IDT0_9PROT|nr:ABC transporter transmembrane domain-containing protein [Roseospira marina]KAA5606441.1 hypothetical protein F1188_06120 [Roseospira marina]MBB4314144.1 ABC-type bacteriocin/lantibiotic exporter with double-glycine peptidase domain [Roseospira marina]MBB5087305.1 ABC-type bacteriocin/lantibiotic exporter with double-glycine peptidase domain [Roseospira marina]